MKSLQLILSNPRYFGVSWVFTSINIWFGTWAIYIPTVKEKLGIDKADLGIALFCLSLGVFTIIPVASKLINRIGVGRASWLGVIFVSATAMLPLMAPNYYLLMGALYLFGAGNGFIDIAINTLVTEIEKEDKQNFMSAAHGFFSLGGILVGLGSFLIPVIGSSVLHMGITVVLVFIINLYFRKHYIHIVAAPVEKEPFSFKLFKPLLLLGIIGFVSFGSEGAIIDWSALYLKEMTKAPEMLIGAGFLAFSTTMTLGRFLGDDPTNHLVHNRFCPKRVGIFGNCTRIVPYWWQREGRGFLPRSSLYRGLWIYRVFVGSCNSRFYCGKRLAQL